MTRFKPGLRVALAAEPNEPIGTVTEVHSWKMYHGRGRSATIRLDPGMERRWNNREEITLDYGKIVPADGPGFLGRLFGF